MSTSMMEEVGVSSVGTMDGGTGARAWMCELVNDSL